MRTNILLVCLLAGALLLAPLALADAGKSRAEAQRAAHAPDHDDDDANETRDARHAARENASANRTTALEGFRAAISALHVSWRENATAVREGCHNATFDAKNATKEQRDAHAHCVRDGYQAWREAHRADLKELREQMRALFSGWGKAHHG